MAKAMRHTPPQGGPPCPPLQLVGVIVALWELLGERGVRKALAPQSPSRGECREGASGSAWGRQLACLPP